MFAPFSLGKQAVTGGYYSLFEECNADLKFTCFG
jgi:hypothetical protein